MRTKHELIQHLIDSLNRVSYRNRNELDAFKHQAETMIKTLYGDTSEYRYQLQAARFAPWAFEASEEDYQKSWTQGKESILNILKTLDADEKLIFQNSDPASSIDSDKIQEVNASEISEPPLSDSTEASRPDTQDLFQTKEKIPSPNSSQKYFSLNHLFRFILTKSKP